MNAPFMPAPTSVIERAARELKGEPNPAHSRPGEMRFGTNGSLSIDTSKGVWYSHDPSEPGKGGVEQLVMHVNGGTFDEAREWCRARGYIAPDQDRQKPRIVQTYDYRDESGAVLYQAVRKEPKAFLQRQPDGRGGWTWNLKGVRLVPYRLPELIAADPSETVYITEGEKDADRLAAAGLVATTSSGGAGKWRKGYAEHFVGRRVCILPDNDNAGREHAMKVAESLASRGIEHRTVTLPGLPDKGDTSDWLNAGGSVEALTQLYQAASSTAPAPAAPDPVLARMFQGLPNYTPPGCTPLSGDAPPAPATAPAQTKPGFSLIRADAMDFVEPEFVIGGLMETETLAMLFADPGSGKSFVALDMAASVATGQGFHGREVKQGAVVYLCGEGKNGIKRRLIAWERHHGVSLKGAPLFVSSMAGQFLNPASVAEMVKAIDGAAQEAGNVALIIVDTLNRNMGAGDESSTADMSLFVRAVDETKDRYNATALIVHHTGHGNKERARGSMVLLGALDAEFRIEKDADTITMTGTKMKDAPVPAPIGFKVHEIEVGRSRIGEAVTSAALSECAAPAPVHRGAKLSPNQQIAMDALRKYTDAHGEDGVSGRSVILPEFLNFLRGKFASENPDSARRSGQRAVKDLDGKGKVIIEDGRIWIV